MRSVLITIIAVLLTGCSFFTKSKEGLPSPVAQRKELEQAVELIKAGNSTSATKLLKAICREKGIPGVTDEALFRLGLLSLRTAPETDTALSHLERLQKEYPTSAWSRMAGPVVDLLEQYEELRSHARSLKNQNQTLSKENRELLQNINRLKYLDLELERKNMRGR